MTARPEDAIRALTETLRTADFTQLSQDLDRLRAIERWAQQQLGFAEGDRVRIRDSWEFPSKTQAPGWWPYRECLVPGATATVTRVTFVTYMDRGWRVDIRLDQEWSVSEPHWRSGEIKRYWHGPAGTTPEGHETPSKYDQQQHPEGRRGIFMMQPESLEKII